MQKTLSLARKSGTLDLSNRNYTTVPKEVFDANTALGEEEKWWEVLKIKKLFLQNNRITQFEKGIEKLGDGLELFDISDNLISSFMTDEQLMNFPFLKELRVNKNRFCFLSFLFSNYKFLFA